MIAPESEDVSYDIKSQTDFSTRKFQLFEHPSPVLPLHFDKSYLPSTPFFI